MTPSLILCLALAVSDGDKIRCGKERIRIFGLDCPELSHSGGRKAKHVLDHELRGRGRTVTFARRGLDRYGRTIAVVYADGRDVTQRMIALGTCWEHCDYSNGGYGTCR
jgi:micrococcal nuclease